MLKGNTFYGLFSQTFKYFSENKEANNVNDILETG